MKLSVILSIPKTILFNLRHLPIKQAVKLSIWVHYRTQVHVKGKIELPKVVKPFMIRIGFHTCEESNYYDETRLSIATEGYYDLTEPFTLAEALRLLLRRLRDDSW